MTKLQLFSLQKKFEKTEHWNFKNSHLSFTLKRRLLHPVVFLVSVVGVASPSMKGHLTAPVWNAAHPPPQLVLVQVVPFFLDSNGELSQAAWSWMSCINSPLKHIPGRLYHIQIWRTCWPVFIYDFVGLFVGCNDWLNGLMAHGIVIHKDEVGWVSLLEGQDDVMQNFITVLGGGHVAFNDLQGDLLVTVEACRHLDGSTTL